MNVDLLENPIMTNIMPDVNDITELTNGDVTKWFDCVFNKKPPNLGDIVTEILKKHRYISNSNDPGAGVQEYFFAVMTYSCSIGVSSFVKDKSHSMSEISPLIRVLQQKEVNELVFCDKKMRKDAEHAPISHFITPASDIAT